MPSLDKSTVLVLLVCGAVLAARECLSKGLVSAYDALHYRMRRFSTVETADTETLLLAVSGIAFVYAKTRNLKNGPLWCDKNRLFFTVLLSGMALGLIMD